MERDDNLVWEARERKPRGMEPRERTTVAGLSLAFLVVAGAIAFLLPAEGGGHPLVVAALVLLYAWASRVEFEIGAGCAVPNQLVFVPMLFVAPLPLVPLLVAAGFLLANVPELLGGRLHRERWLHTLPWAWHTVGPVLVIGLLAPGGPQLDLLWVYALAFAAQVACDVGAALVHERMVHGVAVAETLRSTSWSYRIDAILSPFGLMTAFAAVDSPIALVAAAPMIWLLHLFSRDRGERYATSQELNRAYQGTVMLLSNVIESEDHYTADHCRAVVDLVNGVADELNIHRDLRQELEFAALLHDVGKIAIPNELLNKPGALTEEEWEQMKTHTVEGQLLLNQVGGLLARVGTVVRSCHERWDGAGYPDGLAGEQIPLGARIVFCCDAYNAMTTDRPYRRAMDQEDALRELSRNAGTQFDPQVVRALCTVVLSGQISAAPPGHQVRTLTGAPS